MENTTMRNAFMLILIIFLNLLSCKTAIDDTASNKNINESINKFRLTETKNGKLVWVLESPIANITENSNIIILEAPIIKFYEEGKYSSTLKSSTARIDTKSRDIWGEDDCLLTTVEGDILETKNLHYKPDIQKIVTNDKVKLIRKDETIFGVGMEASVDLKDIIIKDQKVIINETE